MNVTDTVQRVQLQAGSSVIHLTGGSRLTLSLNSPFYSSAYALILASLANNMQIEFEHDGAGEISSLITMPIR
jgi:hypothetical protein